MYKLVTKAFYKFLYGLDNGCPEQVKNLNRNLKRNGNNHKVAIKPEQILTKEDVAMLVKHCGYYRDEAILTVLYESGCRIGEFVGMNVGHLVDVKHGKQLVVNGKTGQRRTLLIESVPYLNQWLEHHPMKDYADRNEVPLWCTLRPPFKRMELNTVQCLLKTLRKRSGINKRMNAHSFRHSRATYLAKFLSDAQMRVVFGWEGASEMVGLYTHLSGKDTDDVILRSSGIVEDEELPKPSPLQEKECSRCHSKNAGTNEYCGLCGLPFDENAVIGQTLEEQKLKDEVKILREEVQKTVGVGEYLDFLDTQIERLQKELAELKNGGSTH
jgi:site-specific recombinase XerD